MTAQLAVVSSHCAENKILGIDILKSVILVLARQNGLALTHLSQIPLYTSLAFRLNIRPTLSTHTPPSGLYGGAPD